MNLSIKQISSNVRSCEELRASLEKAVNLRARVHSARESAKMSAGFAKLEGHPEDKPLMKFIAKTAKISEAAKEKIVKISQELYTNYLLERTRLLFAFTPNVSFMEKLKNIFKPNPKTINKVIENHLY